MNIIAKSLQNFNTLINPMINFNRTINVTLVSMNQYNSMVQNNVHNTNTLSIAQNNLATTNVNLQASAQNAAAGQSKLNNQLNKGNKTAGTIIKSFKKLAGEYLNLNQIKQFMGDSVKAANQQLKSEIRLQSIMENKRGVDKQSIDSLKEYAAQLSNGTTIADDVGITGMAKLAEYVHDPNNVKMMTESMYNLAAATYGANVSQEEIMQTADIMGKAMLGDTQALSAAGINIDALSEAEQRILKTGTEAQRAAMVVEMLEGNLNGVARAMANTPEGQLAQFKNSWGDVKKVIGFGLIPEMLRLMNTVKTHLPQIQGLLLVLVGGFSLVTDAVIGLINGISWIGAAVVDNWGLIEPIVWAAGGLLGAFIIPKIWAMVTAILSTGIAWATTHIPIMLIFLAIGVLICILKEFGITADQVIGFVGGIFGGLYAAIYNYMAYLWNYFASFAEFIGNLFIDPVYAVKKLFYDLTMNVLGFVNSIIQGIEKLINKIPGIEKDLTSGIDSMMESLTKPTSDKDVISIKRMEFKNISETAKKGYALGQSAGEGLMNGISSITDKFKMPEKPDILGMSMGKEVFDIESINTVNEVGKIKNLVDISNEDLKTMRELAEMKNIQNFVSLTPTVSVQTGDITEGGFSIDTIVARITDALENEIAASAEGVYGG
ncbi:phage tail tape measure protein [Alkaliphilus peptidifermentans]|uniref:Phage-related minor tail protein n=1 Tax=Alkaliphilus peptidifermentans DSM 18978 TaxID=1120976 RepID=A0A1G5JXW1_9FIRM|nr:hypothetical protein [Alkaliphilus peptidifermentans]SCY93233.1 hypothetical protein SAMN03080606_03114 [Alkaliphilus peptidifermentans DSM 18978]